MGADVTFAGAAAARTSAAAALEAAAAPEAQAALVARLRAAGCVFAEDEARLLRDAAGTPAELADMVARRVTGEPVEYIVGWAEFCGLRIAVQAGVFVPRRRTEFLARQAVALTRPGSVAVDLCCGSGAVGAVVLAAWNRIELYAADIDPIAVRCARGNLAATGAQVYAGDLCDPLPASLLGRVDVLVANAPYVPSDAVALMPPEARLYEPLVSLDGGADGLAVLRRVIAAAPRWLTPGGQLLFETSQRQAPGAVAAVAGCGLIPRVATAEHLGATVVMAANPAVRGGQY